jgi:outer membrane lipoprotein carrier protein
MDLMSLLMTLLLGAGNPGGAATATPAAKPAPATKPATDAKPAAEKKKVSAEGDTKSSALSADDLVGKVQSFYTSTKQLSARFRQTTMIGAFGKMSISDGKVYIKKPGKMRWDYFSKKDKKKASKSFMSDGTTLWAVYVEDLTFYKKALKDDLLPVAITFLSGKGDLKTDFNAKLDTSGARGEKGDLVLELKPKQPSASYKTLWLVIDPSDYRVKQSVILNSNNDTTSYNFYEPDAKKAVADTWFVFNEEKMKSSGFRQVKPSDLKKEK